MSAPVLGISIDFANGPAFGIPLILDDPSTPLGTGILADGPADVVDVSNIAIQVATRRGRNRILGKFEAGTATVVLVDENGDWNPENTSSPYYGKLLPLRKIRIWADYDDGITTTRYYQFSGYITSYDNTFRVGTDAIQTVTLQCVDAFRLFNNVSISTVSGTPAGQSSGARVDALLDSAAFPTSMRNVDAGDSTLQADPGTQRDLLSALGNVAESEFGAFYMDNEGNATFLSRSTLSEKADQTPTVFTDTGTGLPYVNVDFAYDDTQIFNDVTVTRAGGTPQNVQSTSSIETYFIHSGSRSGILVETDQEALDQATMILNAKANAVFRIDSITLNLKDTSDSALVTAGLDLDIFNLINVTKTTPGASSVTLELFVQGVQHDISNRVWTTKLLTAEPIIQAFILDSATQGVLDGTQGVLSY
jgi:hypothetical protein